jgi:hypothetical protein
VPDFVPTRTSHYPPVVGYHVGQALKYLSRAPHKGELKQDLLKAQFYMARALGRVP